VTGECATLRDRVRSEVFDACAAHYNPKHAAFLAETLLDPIPDAAAELRRIGLAASSSVATCKWELCSGCSWAS